MPNFRVHSVGREKLNDFHKANYELISKDPILQERFNDKLDSLKNKIYPQAPVFKSSSSSSSSSDQLAPVDDILNSITKDDVKKSKKKKTDISSIGLSSDSSSLSDNTGSSNGYVKPESRFVHSSNYYTKKNESVSHAIRVSLFNKAFEKDMM
jgi:cellulase/cellobiase CelA1